MKVTIRSKGVGLSTDGSIVTSRLVFSEGSVCVPVRKWCDKCTADYIEFELTTHNSSEAVDLVRLMAIKQILAGEPVYAQIVKFKNVILTIDVPDPQAVLPLYNEVAALFKTICDVNSPDMDTLLRKQFEEESYLRQAAASLKHVQHLDPVLKAAYEFAKAEHTARGDAREARLKTLQAEFEAKIKTLADAGLDLDGYRF